MENSAIDTIGATATRAAFTCQPGAIEAAAAYLAKRIVERRNTIPILSYVRIAADLRGTVTLTGNNLDQMASITIAADVISPGEFCADAYVLAEVLRKAKKNGNWFGVHEITFTESDARLILKTGRGRFNVPTLPVDDFPVIELAATLSAFTIPAGQFIADLAALSPCMEVKGAKYYLQGVAMQSREMAGRDSLVLVATDGNQMGIASRPIPAGAGDLSDCIIPAPAVAALVAAGKFASDDDTLSAECDGGRVRFTMGAVSITSKLIDGTFTPWEQCFDEMLAPTGEIQEALFPDLLPGAPVARMDKLAKGAPGALTWSPARDGQVASVAGDPDLLFAVMACADDYCGKKGFDYRTEGDGEIIGPDGVTYPVAFSSSAIHLSASQVRALIGESCFETFAVTIAGRVLFILQWLFDDGASRFLSVRKDGRCFAGGEYVTRAQVEAALAGEYVEIASPDSEAVGRGDVVALDSGEAVEALTGLPTGEIGIPITDPIAEPAPEAPDPIAELTARLDALEARLDALPMENGEGMTETVAPTVAKRTPAHERAVRRAWAERKARRAALIDMVTAETVIRSLEMRENVALERIASLQRIAADHESEWIASCNREYAARQKRRRSTMLARDLQKRLNAEYALLDQVNQKRSEAVQAETFQRQRADVLHAQLVKLRDDMADPMQPERASDLAQLIRERDAARVASAASQARAQRAEAATLACADQIEQLASRVARAETLLRNAA